jgi:hypothetical protein
MIFCFTVLKSVENLLPLGHADFAVASLDSTRMLSKMLGKIVSLNIPPIFYLPVNDISISKHLQISPEFSLLHVLLQIQESQFFSDHTPPCSFYSL